MPRVCITVPGKNAQPYRFSLERKIVRLGRAADNDIVVDCPSVSSHHCEMRRIEGGYVLEDLDSTNGITLDDDRMEVIDLKNGLAVKVGDAELDFELNAEEEESLQEEDHTPLQRAKLPPAGSKDDDERPAKRKPKPAPEGSPRVAPPLASSQQASGGVNFLITICFLFLAALAFWMGLAVKHKGATRSEQFPNGRSLWSDVFGSGDTSEEAEE